MPNLNDFALIKEISMIIRTKNILFCSLPKGKIPDSGHCILTHDISNLAKKETDVCYSYVIS